MEETILTSGTKHGMVSGIRQILCDENQGTRSGQEWQHTELASELPTLDTLNL